MLGLFEVKSVVKKEQWNKEVRGRRDENLLRNENCISGRQRRENRNTHGTIKNEMLRFGGVCARRSEKRMRLTNIEVVRRSRHKTSGQKSMKKGKCKDIRIKTERCSRSRIRKEDQTFGLSWM